MIKLIEWIKKHPIVVGICLVLAFLLPLLVVHILYEVKLGIKWIESNWEAGDLLGYIIGFESALSTVILSVLALWQNIKFKKDSDAKDELFLHIESEKIRLAYLPQFLIQSADAEKCIDTNYQLSPQYSEGYVLLKKFDTYCFMYDKTTPQWQPDEKYPVIEKKHINRMFAIVNCGNNSANQVKLSVKIGDQKYTSEKSTSIQKDSEIFFYFGCSKGSELPKDVSLCIRYFDCFQNVYEQEFNIVDRGDYIELGTYTDANLVSRSSAMKLTKNI